MYLSEDEQQRWRRRQRWRLAWLLSRKLIGQDRWEEVGKWIWMHSMVPRTRGHHQSQLEGTLVLCNQVGGRQPLRHTILVLELPTYWSGWRWWNLFNVRFGFFCLERLFFSTLTRVEGTRFQFVVLWLHSHWNPFAYQSPRRYETKKHVKINQNEPDDKTCCWWRIHRLRVQRGRTRRSCRVDSLHFCSFGFEHWAVLIKDIVRRDVGSSRPLQLDCVWTVILC